MLRSEEAVLGAWGFRGRLLARRGRAPLPGRCTRVSRPRPGSTTAAGPCHGPSCFDTGVSWKLQTSQRWRRQGHAASPLCPRPRGHHGSGGLASSPSPWQQHFRADPHVMSSHLTTLQAAFQEEKLSCRSKLGAGGEAQAAVSPADLSPSGGEVQAAVSPADPSPSDPGCYRGPQASMGAGDPGGQLDGWPCSLEGRRCRAPTQLGRPWVGGADLRFVSFCGSRFGFRMEEDGRCSGRQ